MDFEFYSLIMAQFFGIPGPKVTTMVGEDENVRQHSATAYMFLWIVNGWNVYFCNHKNIIFIYYFTKDFSIN